MLTWQEDNILTELEGRRCLHRRVEKENTQALNGVMSLVRRVQNKLMDPKWWQALGKKQLSMSCFFEPLKSVLTIFVVIAIRNIINEFLKGM